MGIVEEIEKNGFSIVPDFVNPELTQRFIDAIQELGKEHQDSNYALRDLLRKIPFIGEWLSDKKTRLLLKPLIGSRFFAVRGLFFNKVPAANWRVAWHQDLTIAVKEKAEVAGFGPWSVKAGITHVQPPDSILNSMLAVRIHLDDCDDSNGPLKVIPGSHRTGRLKPNEIADLVKRINPISCNVRKSGVLVMRPLLLHSSSPALDPGNRRVIHLEVAVEDLPSGLEWFEKVS